MTFDDHDYDYDHDLDSNDTNDNILRISSGLQSSTIKEFTFFIWPAIPKFAKVYEFKILCVQERILKEFDASLARLQLSYVDIIQIHDFEFCQVF